MSVNNETDLRTDACPSPPRNLDSPFTNDHNDESTENVHPKHSKSKPSTKSRSKAGKSNAANIVTMVNINNSKKIHVGDKYNYNLSNAKPTETESAEKLPRTEALTSMLTSSKPVEERHMDFVSGHITVDGWMKVAQNLDFSMGQIQQLHKRCESRGIREIVYNMLIEWKQKEPTMATLGKLGTVLWSNGEEEAASRLANKLFSPNN